MGMSKAQKASGAFHGSVGSNVFGILPPPVSTLLPVLFHCLPHRSHRSCCCYQAKLVNTDTGEDPGNNYCQCVSLNTFNQTTPGVSDNEAVCPVNGASSSKVA